jgi:hypothetical protein
LENYKLATYICKTKADNMDFLNQILDILIVTSSLVLLVTAIATIRTILEGEALEIAAKEMNVKI